MSGALGHIDGTVPADAGTVEGRRTAPATGFWHEMSAGLFLAMLSSFGFAVAWYLEASVDGKIVSAIGVILVAGGVRSALYHPGQFPIFLVCYIPFGVVYPFNMGGGGGGLNMTNVLLLLAFVAWISSRKSRPRSLPLGFFEMLVGFFVFLGLLNIVVLGLLFAPPMSDIGRYDPIEAALEFKRWVMPVLVFFLVRGTVASRLDIRRIVIAVMWATFLTAALTWHDGLALGGRSNIDDARIGGILLQANSMGAFLAYYGVVLLAFYMKSRHWVERSAYLVGLLFALRATLYTFSRGSYLSWATSGALVLLLSNPLYLIGGVGAGYAFPQYLPDSIQDRVASTNRNAEGEIYNDSVVAGADKSVDFRFVLWRGGIRMAMEYPLLGVGMGRFPDLVDRFTDVHLSDDDPRDAHNAYIGTAAELGIPALVVMVGILLMVIATAARQYVIRRWYRDRGLALAVLGMTTAVTVSCLWGSRFDDGAVIGMFWVLVALLMVQRQLGHASEEAS